MGKQLSKAMKQKIEQHKKAAQAAASAKAKRIAKAAQQNRACREEMQ